METIHIKHKTPKLHQLNETVSNVFVIDIVHLHVNRELTALQWTLADWWRKIRPVQTVQIPENMLKSQKDGIEWVNIYIYILWVVSFCGLERGSRYIDDLDMDEYITSMIFLGGKWEPTILRHSQTEADWVISHESGILTNLLSVCICCHVLIINVCLWLLVLPIYVVFTCIYLKNHLTIMINLL